MKIIVSQHWMGLGAYSGPVELTGRYRYAWPYKDGDAPTQVEIVVPFASGSQAVWVAGYCLAVEREASK